MLAGWSLTVPPKNIRKPLVTKKISDMIKDHQKAYDFLIIVGEIEVN